MIVVAAVGIVVNGLTALLFARGREHDINIRGAYLHMASDALVSLAVVFPGFVILWTGQRWVDPVMSLAVAIVILWGSIGLLKESVWMSLAGVPRGHRRRPGRSRSCASSTASSDPRPSHLAAEHDGDRIDRAHRHPSGRLSPTK